MLSSVLAIGSAVSVYAAPASYAKRAANSAQRHAAVQQTVGTRQLPEFSQYRPEPIPGIIEVKSEMTEKRNTALRSATAAQRAVAASIDLRGHLHMSSTWGGSKKYGIYTVPTSESQTFEMINAFDNIYNMGAVDNGRGRYYGLHYELLMGFFPMATIDIYDTTTTPWGMIVKDGLCDFSSWMVSGAADPISGDIYGLFIGDEDSIGPKYWGIANYDMDITGESFATSIPIKECDLSVMSVACDYNGQYYALGTDKILYKIDKNTGGFEEIAVVDIPYQYACGGCINSANNTYLHTYTTDEGCGLVEIDLETGETTLLYEFPGGEQVVGLYISNPTTGEKAPGEPAIEVSCLDGSMDVNLKLTMPSTLFDGTPVQGQTFTYTVVTSDGVQVATGEALSGSEVNRTVTMTEAKHTTFLVSVANADGASTRAMASCYVGKGTPSQPTNVKFTWADNTSTITWSPVTVSSDGGFLDPASVTYTVSDANGDELVTGLSATTYTTEQAVPEDLVSVFYLVRADYEGKSSESAKSNTIPLGSLDAPLNMDMTKQENFDIHTVLDNNEDECTWEFGSGVTRYVGGPYLEADDWLFSPAVRLTAGLTYKFTAEVAPSSNQFDERFEIRYGREATAEGMTVEVVPPTVLHGATYKTFEAYITPSATATFHIGFHAISDIDKRQIQLKSYTFEEAIFPSAPEVVTDISVKRNLDDNFKADISFTAPLKAIDGSDLSGNVTVKVYRNDAAEAVKTVTLAPGASTSFQDGGITESDTYTYTFVPANAAGETGKKSEVSVFIGLSKPASVTGIVGYADGNTIKLSWDPVTLDINGDPVSPRNITYNVWAANAKGVLTEIINSEPLTETHFEIEAVERDIQTLAVYGVGAVNVDLKGTIVGTTVAVGPAYGMPVEYSGAESARYYVLSGIGSGSLSYGSYGTLGVMPFGGDDYYAVQHAAMNGRKSIVTGKIEISGDSPVVTFRSYKVAEADANETEVAVFCDGVLTPLATFSNADYDAFKWNKMQVSLADFKDKEVQIYISSICRSHAFSLYDEIQICEEVKYDLMAKISGPMLVETGEEFDVNVTVCNEGSYDAASYAVDLYRNGEVVESRNCKYGLAGGEEETLTFKQTVGVQDSEDIEYKAVVVFAQDEMPGNNETMPMTVKRRKLAMPVVTGLSGDKTADGHTLTWDAIDLTVAHPVCITEDFESGDSFAFEFEGWTFVDGDGETVGGFQDYDVPGIVPGITTCSFFVFDNSDDVYGSELGTTSGTKFLASLFSYEGNTIDDWAISPLLTGEAQTISFQAKSFSADYPEKIEVWYTTDDSTNPDDFVKVEAFGTKTLEDVFSLFTADLPAGTKRFAIRSCATDSFMLMVDDVTYSVLKKFDNTLLGYNVYCDGVKLNDAPLAQPTYNHVPGDDNGHTYHVTAVYDNGESELSEPVTIGQTGIDSILAAGLKVCVEGKSIVVTGAEGKLVTIYSVDGRTIYSAQGDARVAVNAAIYLVTIDRKTVKVAVR